MKRILYVHGGLLNRGGTEAVMMNYCRHFDHDRVQVDFALHGAGTGVYDMEVTEMGGTIFHVPVKSQNLQGNISALRDIMQKGNYAAVHAHMDAGNALVLKIAKECGVPIRVSHSHNTSTQTANPVKKWFNSLEKRKIPKVATQLFACSDLAGKWLYGNHPFTVINNAVDVQKFAFSSTVRDAVRTELQIADDATVLGHVGRFSYQKNHEKLIEIFCAFHKNNLSSKLMLIGEGETLPAVQAQIKELHLQDAVLFVPPTPEVCRYMQAMDCFVLPSRFEGLPVVMVEAQAAGLPVVVSDAVSEKSKITDLVRFVPLTADRQWCDAIAAASALPRKDYGDAMRSAGYDIAANAKAMQKFYETGELTAI